MNSISRWRFGLLAAALAVSAALGTVGSASAEDNFPLKKWMQANMGANKDDAKALAPAFKKVAAFQPDPGWGDWKALSDKGAALAAAGSPGRGTSSGGARISSPTKVSTG